MQNHSFHERRNEFVLAVAALADELFHSGDAQTEALPQASLDRLREAGCFTAPLPVRFGGLGLGTEPGGQLPLLRVLAALGGADLALGRLYEGHANALILASTFGQEAQVARLALDAHEGKLFAVWNTGDPVPMRLEPRGSEFLLQGCKTFATGAGTVQRPIVTAEHQGWQMVIPCMDRPSVAAAVHVDTGSWQPFGMKSSESFSIEFQDAPVGAEELLGKPGDFYREPLFSGGAIRFAAVQAGAVLRLSQMFADSITSRGRQTDPYQLARLGEVELLAQGATLWLTRAGADAEQFLWSDAPAEESRKMVRSGQVTRLAIERCANGVISHVVPGVGAHGLLQPARFERILRDLTMYLRQPNPDGTLAAVGKSTLLQGSPNHWTPLSTVDQASTAELS